MSYSSWYYHEKENCGGIDLRVGIDF
jgi:hypothetical protein